MDENQGVPSPCSDHICCNNGLSECRGRRKHTGFVLEKRGDRLFLFGRQFAEKPRLKGPSLLAFVPQLGRDAHVRKKPQQIVETSSWEGDVFREQLGTRDDAWLAKSR
jgi:hypothetical protein